MEMRVRTPTVVKRRRHVDLLAFPLTQELMLLSTLSFLFHRPIFLTFLWHKEEERRQHVDLLALP